MSTSRSHKALLLSTMHWDVPRFGSAAVKLLKTYEDRDEAKEGEFVLTGAKRLASERDDTTTIYNLFGEATWGNLFKLQMYRLVELKELLSRRGGWDSNDLNAHSEILKLLAVVEKTYDLEIPQHWR